MEISAASVDRQHKRHIWQVLAVIMLGFGARGALVIDE